MKAFAHLFNVIDNAGQTVRCHRNGGRGFVSATAGACPAHDIEVWHLLEAGQYDEAQAERDRVSAALAPVREQVAANGGGYRLVKGMMEVIGRPAGPPRLPTEPLNDAEKAQLRAAMEQIGWV
jgi:4-hydroxy-tetrahydrodipicolinate synthase